MSITSVNEDFSVTLKQNLLKLEKELKNGDEES